MPAILFRVNGSIVPAIRFQSVSIHDVLGAQPNTATLTFDNRAVHADVGAAIQIGAGDFVPPHLLFAGQVQHLVETYQSDVRQARLTEWPADLIDHVFALNRRRPFASYVNQSATAIAQDLVARYAPGCTTTHVQAGLPTLTINFDGTTPLMDALNQVAQAIGGRTKIDYLRDLHLFIPPELGIPDPDPIGLTNPPLNVPEMQFDVDLSQVRTRVYGKGHGEQTPTDVLANETILPIADAVFFNPLGGRAVAGLTSDGAQTQRLTYTGLHVGEGGTIAGPGIAPGTAPVVALTGGSGIDPGLHDYVVTFVTATGESLPGPRQTITAGLVAPAAAAPTLALAPGGSVTAGTHEYAYTHVTATGGETPPGPTRAIVTGGPLDPPTLTPTIATTANTGGVLTAGGVYRWRVTYGSAPVGNADGGPPKTPQSAVGPASAPYTAVAGKQVLFTLAGAIPAWATWVNIYRTTANGSTYYIEQTLSRPNFSMLDPSTLLLGWRYTDAQLVAQAAAPTVGDPSATVVLSDVLPGPAATTARKIYRTAAAGGALKLLDTIADNATTTYTDTLADASLGATAPATNTAIAQQGLVSAIAVGPSGVTARKIYRSAANATALKLLATIANNTATTYTDSAADATLGAAVPATDTSGLTAPPGQINAGSTTLLTAGLGPLPPTGGWVRNGEQFIRYTGVTGNTLTGIPSSGAGSISTTIPYGAQVVAVPALVGVAGNPRPIQAGSAVAVFVQRDDVDAQAALGALERNPDGTATDGIREYMLTDERRGEPSLIDLCDADLGAFARPIIGVTYATRDPKSKAGQTTHIDLRLGANGVFNPAVFNPAVFHTGPTPGETFGYAGDFLIQEVTITIDPTADPLPRYLVRASSSRFTFADLLQRVALVS